MFGAAPLFAVLGALCGAGFAILLAGAERQHTVDDLGRRRTTFWGAVAGAACVVAYLGVRGSLFVWMTDVGLVVRNLGIFGALGALSSYGSLAIARQVSLPKSVDRREIAALCYQRPSEDAMRAAQASRRALDG